MIRYRISELRESKIWQWVVIAIDDESGNEEWISKHATQGEANEAVHRLASKALDRRLAR